MGYRSKSNYEAFDAAWREACAAPDGSHWIRSPLLRALITCYFWRLFPAAPLLLLQNVSQLFLPFLIGPLIEFMDNDDPLYIGKIHATLNYSISVLYDANVAKAMSTPEPCSQL